MGYFVCMHFNIVWINPKRHLTSWQPWTRHDTCSIQATILLCKMMIPLPMLDICTRVELFECVCVYIYIHLLLKWSQLSSRLLSKCPSAKARIQVTYIMTHSWLKENNWLQGYVSIFKLQQGKHGNTFSSLMIGPIHEGFLVWFHILIKTWPPIGWSVCHTNICSLY